MQGELINTKIVYEFVFIPNSDFLNSNLPLMKNCEMKLSFDRLNAIYGPYHTDLFTNYEDKN